MHTGYMLYGEAGRRARRLSGGSSSSGSGDGRMNDGYRKRRERNNIAVKKSREKSRQKARETEMRVNELKEENAKLEDRVSLLSKELGLLKELLLSQAGGGKCDDVKQEEEEYNREESTTAGSYQMQADLYVVNLDHVYSGSRGST